MAKIKKGDKVIVLSGKDKGVTGRVIRAIPREDRVVVEGVNMIKRHTPVRQAQGRQGQSGGIITQEAPIHVSNVALVVEVDGDDVATRVGYRTGEDGKKVRYAKKTGEEI